VRAPNGTRIALRFGRVRLALGVVFLVAIVLILWFALLGAGTAPLQQPFVLFAMFGGGGAAALALYQQRRPGGDRREVLVFLRTTLEADELPRPAAG
jgi:peptidoglycan/LPS O-acetylase OafA/YrhL